MLSSLQGHNGFLQRQLVDHQRENGDDRYGKSTRKSKSKDAAVTHAVAERKRRERINSHLHTLKKLFPYLPKKDKPRVLTEVVTQLKELRKNIAQQLELSSLFLPSENDEVIVNYCDNEERTVKTTICCEDRPGLNRDLSSAIRLLQGRVIKAEMATVGGRTKAEMVVVLGGNKANGGEKNVVQLKRALKAVVENRALGLGSSVILGKIG
ncbi:putative transcription factor bHLH107 [Lycium ferocissimum]|uniref:putative transcription factor bHLH107 n=1 Tax=Lycium ferocissimum TaxID=112874 RepID=UPI002815A4C3|nr:putative transcription factor bHLH107 [Lycium ferocissimum]